MGVLPGHDCREKRVPKLFNGGSLLRDPSLAVHTPVTTSWFDLPPKKRWMIRALQDSTQKTKRSRFETLREEEDHCSRKIQKFYDEMRELFAPENGLATKKAIKKCPRLSIVEGKKKKMKRKIPKKTSRGPVVSNKVTERLKRFITGEMNGSDMKLVIQKNLYYSDLKPNQNRLNMPIKQLETPEFLTDDEKRNIGKGGIKVRLVGPTLQMYEKPMWLKMWHMEHTSNYVLITNWNEFVADNKEHLKKDSKIQVWSFRKDQQLCFAIVIVERPDAVNDVA